MRILWWPIAAWAGCTGVVGPEEDPGDERSEPPSVYELAYDGVELAPVEAQDGSGGTGAQGDE